MGGGAKGQGGCNVSQPILCSIQQQRQRAKEFFPDYWQAPVPNISSPGFGILAQFTKIN